MSLSDVFRDRYYIPGWVYIQGSASEGVLKFGITVNLNQRTGRNRTQKYGGIGDWKLLYRVWVENCGRIETDALACLKKYKVTRIYLKDGHTTQRSKEIVKCDFSTALEALESCIGESKRASAWRSKDTGTYEFSRELQTYVRSITRRANPRAPIGMPARSLLFMKVDELELSVRSENCLRNDGIFHIGTLVQKSEAEMLRTSNFGAKSLTEIKESLAHLGLKLGMEVGSWPPHSLDDLSERIAPFLKRVDDLELSVRSTNCLQNANIFYIGELVRQSEPELLRKPNFGRKSLNEIKDVLEQLGLHLGMNLSALFDFSFAD